MRRIISLLLAVSLLLSFAACGEYNPPVDNGAVDTDKEDNGSSNTPSGGTEQRGEPFVATVVLNGKPYTPPTVTDDSLAMKVRWTDGKTYHTANVGGDGKAECYGLDGEYSLTLLNLPDGYTYDPNIYVADNDNREVVIELLKLSSARGEGNDVYKCIKLSGTGVYRAEITYAGQEVFYEFSPTRAGVYRIESMIAVSDEMYDPVLDIYNGSSQYKVRDKRIEGGGSSGTYTTNFKYVVQLGEEFVGNDYTFAIMLEGKDATYPTYVDFIVSYEGHYVYEGITSNFVYPSSIPNRDFSTWYDNYLTYLAANRTEYGDSDYKMAYTVIDGKRVFDQTGYKLNPDDGYYHVYDEEKYAEYGGWGPILYANISIETYCISVPFTEVESTQKNLTLSNGTENYKLFIEGFDALISTAVSYFCIQGCKCLATNGGVCPTENRCTTCTDDCRHIPAKYVGQRGYADIAVSGRCPVTEELKDFLHKYCERHTLFSDGDGIAETIGDGYYAFEDSMWLFACGYYTK